MHGQVLSLDPQQLSRGLVTSSTGNHALAFQYACKCLGTQGSDGGLPLLSSLANGGALPGQILDHTCA